MNRRTPVISMMITLGMLAHLSCSDGPSFQSGTVVDSTSSTFSLTSDAGTDYGTLPVEYTCDGAGSTIALAWTNAPGGTQEFALMMTTLPGDGTTKWSWVLYNIPATVTGLAKNSTGVGILGTGSHRTSMAYDPPCSQGPGAKLYTFTLYALSASPSLTVAPDQVTGQALTAAIAPITLDTAFLNLSYSRPTTTTAPHAVAVAETARMTNY